jgi:hypothetical protein
MRPESCLAFAWRDGMLFHRGCIALAAEAVAGSYPNAVIASAMLGAFGACYMATALSRSAGEVYENSPIFAASQSRRPVLFPDKASR